jgi:lambda family phage minor tail protein L
MTINVNLIAESQKINPSAVIQLYKLDLNAKQHGVVATYTFHDGTNILGSSSTDIVWNSVPYIAFPVQIDGYEYLGNGQLPQPKMKVANVNGMITQLLKTIRILNPGNDLIGAKLTRIRTFARFLDAVNFEGNVNPTADPTAEWPREVYYVIQKSAETRDVVEFTLASAFDLQGVRAPKRQCLSNTCSWVYRSSECGYTGSRYYKENNELTTYQSEDDCGKTLDSCRKRFGQLETVGTVTEGSLYLNNVDSAVIPNISPGDSIIGFGLPSGTYVVTVNQSARSLFLSKYATATNSNAQNDGSLQREGYLVENGSRIRVTTPGYAPNAALIGMIVTGPLIPTDEMVTISNVVYGANSQYDLVLSIPFNKSMYGELRGTRENAYVSTLTNGTVYINWSLNDPMTTVAVGDYIANANVVPGTKVQTVSIYNNSVQLTRAPLISSGYIGTLKIYGPAAVSTGIYSFYGQRTYLIKTGSYLPFGGFPGLSSYIAE